VNTEANTNRWGAISFRFAPDGAQPVARALSVSRLRGSTLRCRPGRAATASGQVRGQLAGGRPDRDPAPRPVCARAGQDLRGHRCPIRLVDAQPLEAGLGCGGARVVDADRAGEGRVGVAVHTAWMISHRGAKCVGFARISTSILRLWTGLPRLRRRRAPAPIWR